MQKVCKICGATFTPTYPKTIYCSRDCKNKAKEHYAEKRRAKEDYARAKYNKALSEIASKAKSAGMTYGNYVAAHHI